MLEDAGATTWNEEVEGADKLTVVYFYAPWCRACKAALPRLQKVEKRYADRVAFKQVDFKAETELCYRLRIFAFPTVLFYLPGIGRVASGELTAPTTEEILTSNLDRLLQGRELYERLSAAGAAAAITPVVQYSELVGSLQGLAEMTDSTREMEARLAERRKEAEKRIRRVATEAGLSVAITRDTTYEPSLSSIVSPKESTRLGLLLGSRQEAARLRALVQGDDEYVERLEKLYHSLDSNGRPHGGLKAAIAALQPSGPHGSELVKSLSSSLAIEDDAAMPSVDQPTFIELMVNKTVRDFANGADALLPAFQALDADGDGVVSETELVSSIDHFCTARPDADGCALDQRSLKLSLAFRAFANDAGQLEYDGFVEMVQSRFRQAPATLPPALAVLATPSAAADEAAAVQAAPAKPSFKPNEADLRLPTRCLHEAVGTALIVTGASAGAAALSSSVATAAITGCCVAAAVATFAATSGAHFNPSVTLALVVDNQFGWSEVPAYLLAQLLGACAASTAVAKLSLVPQVALPAAAPPVFIEGFLTAVLVSYCFSLGDLSKREVIKPAFVPILVGCLIFSINSLFARFAASYNPAMATGSRLVAMVLGGWGARACLRGISSYVVGSLIGGVVGCKLYQRLVGNRAYDKVCSWICAEGPRARAA